MKVIDYLVGNYRCKLYHSWFKFLIRKHIREQYEYRLMIMNPSCYNLGECIKCGCSVPQLQFANKSCEDICYPKMMSKGKWKVSAQRGLYLRRL